MLANNQCDSEMHEFIGFPEVFKLHFSVHLITTLSKDRRGHHLLTLRGAIVWKKCKIPMIERADDSLVINGLQHLRLIFNNPRQELAKLYTLGSLSV